MQQNTYHGPDLTRETPPVAFRGSQAQGLLHERQLEPQLCRSLVTNNRDNKLRKSRKWCSTGDHIPPRLLSRDRWV